MGRYDEETPSSSRVGAKNMPFFKTILVRGNILLELDSGLVRKTI